jgi:alpha-amylase
VTSYQNWIKEFVQTYSIDGLRIDAAKHVREDFWPGFCEAAGVFCIGEVFAHDMPYVSSSLSSPLSPNGV